MEFWDSQEIIGEVARTPKHKIVVSRVEKGVKKYIDIRNFYTTNAAPDTWIPSKGIAIPEEYVSEIVAFIQRSME